jgi:hypothetical protein
LPVLQRAERYALDPPFRHSKLRRGCECTLKRPPMYRPPLLPAPPGAPCTTAPGSATCNTAMHRSPCSSDNSATRFSPDESGSTSPIRSHQPHLRLIAMALGSCAACSVAQHSARFLRFSTAGSLLASSGAHHRRPPCQALQLCMHSMRRLTGHVARSLPMMSA